MSISKLLLVLIFLIFLGGCASKPCPPPGQPNLSGQTCNYKLLIDDVDTKSGMVKARVPESVLIQNQESGKKDGESRDYTNYPRDTVYTFFVADPKSLVPKKGTEVEFHRRPIGEATAYSNSLELGRGAEKHME